MSGLDKICQDVSNTNFPPPLKGTSLEELAEDFQSLSIGIQSLLRVMAAYARASDAATKAFYHKAFSRMQTGLKLFWKKLPPARKKLINKYLISLKKYVGSPGGVGDSDTKINLELMSIEIKNAFQDLCLSPRPSIKRLLILLDYLSLEKHLKTSAKFELPGTRRTLQIKGYDETLLWLEKEINQSPKDRDTIARAYNLGPIKKIETKLLYKRVLTNMASRSDLKGALAKARSLNLPSPVKKAFIDYLTLMDAYDYEYYIKGSFPADITNAFEKQGAIPALKQLFAAITTDDKKRLAALFGITQPLTPGVLLQTVLPKPADDTDLQAAFAKINQSDCKTTTREPDKPRLPAGAWQKARYRIGKFIKDFNVRHPRDMYGRERIHAQVVVGAQTSNRESHSVDVSLLPTAAYLLPNLLFSLGLGSDQDPLLLWGEDSFFSALLNTKFPYLQGATAAFELAGHLQSDILLLNTDYVGRFNLGINPRLLIKKVFFLEYHASLHHERYDFKEPRRGFPDGYTLGWKTGAGIGVRTRPVEARVTGYYTSTRLDYQDPIFNEPFEGYRQNAGIEGRLNAYFSRLGKHALLPDIMLRAGGAVWGEETIPIPGGKYLVDTRSWELHGALRFSNMKYPLYFRGGYSWSHHQTWDPSTKLYLGLGIENTPIGDFELSRIVEKNPASFYIGTNTVGMLTYIFPSPPEASWLGLFSLVVVIGHMGGEDSTALGQMDQTFAGANLKFNIGRAFFPPYFY